MLSNGVNTVRPASNAFAASFAIESPLMSLMNPICGA